MFGLHVFSSSPCQAFLHVQCLYPKHTCSFQHEHFALFVNVNSYKSTEVGSWKILKDLKLFAWKRVWTHPVTYFSCTQFASNLMYNCQWRQYMRISNFFYWPSYVKVFISGEILWIHTSPLTEIYPGSYFFHCPVLSFQCTPMLQLTYYHLIPAHSLPFSFTSVTCYMQVDS